MGIWKTALLLTAALVIVLLVSRSIRKTVCVAAGYGIYALFGELYDKILWPIVQGRYGLTGAVAMSAGALVINFSLLIIYQKCGVDWLGVSLLDDLQKRTSQVRASLKHGTARSFLLRPPVMVMQAAMWMLQTPWSAFILLTVWEDSFVPPPFFVRAGSARSNAGISAGGKTVCRGGVTDS